MYDGLERAIARYWPHIGLVSLAYFAGFALAFMGEIIEMSGAFLALSFVASFVGIIVSLLGRSDAEQRRYQAALDLLSSELAAQKEQNR